ncbi:MAG: bifunctional DNA primase/polymerase, partial [Nocardiaceae bacterium]|nr:bifunctional DNA primase/polymerase [Nocardiaceae bacterium]
MADSSDPFYPQAAPAYWQAGWRGVLPFAHRTKKPAPSVRCAAHPKRAEPNCPDCISYTGYSGVDPSYADLLAWSEDFPNGNLGLRLPSGVIGIDVDAYGAKTGAEALAEAQRRWGQLPAGPRSTSRTDSPVSGIRLFRIPPGMLLEQAISFPEMSIGDIDIIQHHHRYTMVWPSIHPEGRPYWWLNAEGQTIGIPEPDSLPWLPESWQNALKLTPRTFDMNAESYDVRGAITQGEMSGPVHARVQQAIRELNTPGQSRHDTACRHVIALLRLGKNGEPGVHPALTLLCETFIAVTQVDHSRTPDVARSEFGRMITNPNAARELSQPGLTDWIRSVIVEEFQKPAETQSAPPAPGADSQQPDGASDEHVLQPDDGTAHSSAPSSHLEEIERGFWQSRESLNIIYTASLARMCSPWSVLAFCVARTLQQVRPNWTLPPIIGGPGSLNWFAAIVDRSGGGKTISKSLARELIPAAIVERNLGSGEGITTAFRKPGVKKDDHGESNVAV